MKKFILKNAMALVALAIAGTTLMSAGLVETESVQTSYWYEVTPHDSDPNQDLVTTTAASEANTPGCNEVNQGDRCSVELNAPLSSPMTVANINASSSLNIEDEKFSNP